MNFRIKHRSLVISFLDIGFSSENIDQLLTPYIENYIAQIDKQDLIDSIDWEVQFFATYSNSRVPLVSKNRIGSYFSEHVKEITIVIPVPLKSEVSWGVGEEKHIYQKDNYDKLMRNFRELEVDFKQFTNRQDYIVECLQKGISTAFTEGFTVDGVKVKIKKNRNLYA